VCGGIGGDIKVSNYPPYIKVNVYWGVKKWSSNKLGRGGVGV